jgi:hypothetical protein
MKLVEIPLGTPLYEPYTPIERVYFPEDGVASLVTGVYIASVRYCT